MTNAVAHSGCECHEEIEVRVRVGTELLEVAVYDPGHSDYAPTARQDEDVSGLAIVQRLAHSWGVEQHGGRLVWAQLRLDKAPE